MAQRTPNGGSSPTSKNPKTETLLLRVPRDFIDYLDAQRGEMSRAALAVVALARGLGVANPEERAPRRGRPKHSPTVNAPAENQDAAKSKGAQPPDKDAGCISQTRMEPRSAVAFLRVVDWKEQLKLLPFFSDGEAPRTLYVACDGTYIRWSLAEPESALAKKLYGFAKRSKADWDPNTGWTFSDPAKVETARRHAIDGGWRVASAAELSAPLILPIDVMQCGVDGWFLTMDNDQWRAFADAGSGGRLRKALQTLADWTGYGWTHDPFNPSRLNSIPMTKAELDSLVEKSETSDWRIGGAWRVAPDMIEAFSQDPVRVAEGDPIRATIDLVNSLHLAVLAREIARIRRGSVGASLTLPRAEWNEIAERFLSMGGRIEATASRSRLQSAFDFASVPGWESPAPNGKTLFAHQKEGIEFLLGRNMRAVLGDEMGLGKTAQAVIATVAAGAKRVLVIAPANARFVWEREIRGWAGADAVIVHIEDALSEAPLPECGWIITTFDLLVARAETWRAANIEEADIIGAALTRSGSRLFDEVKATEAKQGRGPTSQSDAFRFDPRRHPGIGGALRAIVLLDPERAERLRRIARRLSGEIFARLQTWDPDLVFVDEAQRIKNADAGRTRVVRELVGDANRGAVLLTGTPLRNHAGEGAALIEAIFPGAASQLARHKAMHRSRDEFQARRQEAVAELLKTVMKRRLKDQVLDLPPKLRQFIEVQPSGDDLKDYFHVLRAARDEMREAINSGKTLGEAKRCALGLLAAARRLLGRAKIAAGGVADFIDEIVEERGACLVFTYHQDVTDVLAKQLRAKKRTLVTVDGRTKAKERAEAEQRFQEGEADVFIGGINAAGESITLTRADTCVFVELDWVPAALLQAEDRGHRAGQKSASYHIITLIARTPEMLSLDEEVAEVLQDKLDGINATLGEDTQLIADRTGEASILQRIVEKLLSAEELAQAEAKAGKDRPPARECASRDTNALQSASAVTTGRQRADRNGKRRQFPEA
jgi:hypothetical protein